MEYLQTFFSWIWSAFKNVIIVVIGVLPDSPFRLITNSEIGEYIGYLNWIIPIQQITAILQLWLVAIGIFYIYQAILRWVKAVN
jgi:hypothetical protein